MMIHVKTAIKRVKEYRDYYGFDIVGTENLRTKKDCYDAIESHRKWLEDALIDAGKQLDLLESELELYPE
jgi:hypothetical protein